MPSRKHCTDSKVPQAAVPTRRLAGIISVLSVLLVCFASSAADGSSAVAATQPTTRPTTRPVPHPEVLPGVHRILVLGDSITYAGGYVDELDLYLLTHFPSRRIELLDLGIPSETVTGLTEPEHPFPRPDVHERLDRTLRMLREAHWTPELVLACYGMNDGIYRPLDGERFAKFRDGMARLVKRVEKDGISVTILTPPPFDPRPAIAAGTARTAADGQGGYTGPYVAYDSVLARYGDWLLSQRESAGWDVIDLHEPLRAAEMAARQGDPSFALADDGIHPAPLGHWLIARQVLRHWHLDPDDDFPPPTTGARRWRGPSSRPATAPSTTPASADRYADVRKLIARRRKLLSDAWLTHIGHKRPGMEKGLPVEEATVKAEEISREIDREVSALIGRPRVSLRNIRMPDRVEMFSFSPDGHLVAGGGRDPSVYVLDVTTGKQVAKLDHGMFACIGLKFSADGSRLFCAAGSGLLDIHRECFVWSLKDGKQFVPHHPPPKVDPSKDPLQQTRTADMTPDGRTLLLQGERARGLFAINLETGAMERRPVPGGLRYASDILVSPDGKRATLVTFDPGEEPQRELVALPDFAPIHSARASPDASCFWSADGKRLIAAERDKHGLRLFDWQTDRDVARLTTDEDFDDWDLSPEGRWLATSKGALRLWDLHSGRMVAELQPDWFALAEPHFSYDGKYIAALDRQTTPPGPRVLRMWNLDGLVPPEVLHQRPR